MFNGFHDRPAFCAFLGGPFHARNVKMLAISCDGLESHKGWMPDIKAHTGYEVNFPIIADPDRRLVFFVYSYVPTTAGLFPKPDRGVRIFFVCS